MCRRLGNYAFSFCKLLEEEHFLEELEERFGVEEGKASYTQSHYGKITETRVGERYKPGNETCIIHCCESLRWPFQYIIFLH